MSNTPSLDQLLAHVLGDYVLQTDHQAQEKTRQNIPAALHALTYTAAFLPITRDPRALATIATTHFFIDRYRLARYLNYAKNQAAPKQFRPPFPHLPTDTGYSPDRPPFLTVWLLIITDNFLHLTINRLALKYAANRRAT